MSDLGSAGLQLAPWTGLLVFLGAVILAIVSFLGSLTVAVVTIVLNRQQADKIEALRHEQTVILEHIRADLNARAFERETRFARLHERRIEVLADLYDKTLAAEEVIRNHAGFATIRAALEDIRMPFLRGRLWFDARFTKEHLEFHMALQEAWLGLREETSERLGVGDIESPWERFEAVVPPARERMERYMKELLGVLDPPSTTDAD